jgi:riboflavin kinase/FMN adenylyltransferase
MNFEGNLYDQKIRVNFIARLREEIKFSNIDELICQIRKDIMDARLLFLDDSMDTD